MKLTVKITPNAKRNFVEGFKEGVLKIQIKAPPEKGKANDVLISFLADFFHINKNEIRIKSGHTSRIKILEIDNDIEFSSKNEIKIYRT